MKRVLVLASVASMIDQFNIPNIELLQEMGYSVDVACNFKDGNTCSEEKVTQLTQKLSQMKVRCYQVDIARDITNIARNAKALWQVKHLLGLNQYALVHCHSPIGGVIARIAGRMTKTKIIYTAHGFHFFKGAPLINWLTFYPIEKILSYITDTIVTINDEDYVLAKKRMKASKIYRIPGIGVDSKKFNLSNFNRHNYRENLGISRDDFMILSVGELNDNKNHSLVIESVAKINDKRIHYFIVGVGGKNNEYIQLAEKLGIIEQIHLLGFRTDIAELNSSADLFAFPSIREGLGMAPLEALTTGIPVCGMNTRGINEYVVNGKTGYLFDNNVDSCSTAILNVKELKKDERQIMKQNCLNEAKKFSSEKTKNIMLKIYE